MKEPAFVAFFCEKGADVIYEGVHTVSDADPTPVDISLYTIRVKAERKDGTVVFDNPATVTDGPNGKYTWPITHTQSDVATGLCRLDIWRTDVNGERALVIGTLKIGRDVRYGV